jgi:hypothetical protein
MLSGPGCGMPYHVISTGWLQADGVVWYHVLSIRVQEHYTNIAIGSPVYGLQIGHCMICKRYGVSHYGFGSHHVMSSSPKKAKAISHAVKVQCCVFL